MASKIDYSDDESFIILGTSPGTSLDVKCGDPNSDLSLEKLNLEDALKDLPNEANMAFKAHFKLGECPSPASLMVASTMVTDDATTEDLQKRFGELLDENVILKEALKQNNESIKEQFLMIASCQEDMLNTQKLHKEKFDETKDLVEKLRQENKRLKLDLQRREEGPPDSLSSKSGASSGLEFVTSPDDDMVNKLTAQLELVEKQRRQALVDNDKLRWQKESLEHIVDATSKERDDIKDKLNILELQLSNKDTESAFEINSLKTSMQDLQKQLETSKSATTISPEEILKRDKIIQHLDGKVSNLQSELKTSQLKILELENVKLEFTKYKSGSCDTVKWYKEQLHELQNKLKNTQAIMFQPVQVSLNSENEQASSLSEYSSFVSNVKVYDRTLKHLADMLNSLSAGLSDNLVEALGVSSSLLDFKLERCTADELRACLEDLRRQLEEQHKCSLKNIVHVKSTLSIFEGIFKEYNELLKKMLTKTEIKPASQNIEALTSGLVARKQEIQNLEAELRILRNEKDDVALLKAQIDSYKSDFEAERESRTKLAAEKENLLVDLRMTRRKVEELTQHLEEVRRLNSDVYRSASSRAGAGSRNPASPPSANSQANKKAVLNGVKGAKKKSTSEESVDMTRQGTPPPQRYDCPVCDRPFKTLVQLQQHVCPNCQKFKTDDLEVLHYHSNYCLDQNDACNPI